MRDTHPGACVTGLNTTNARVHGALAQCVDGGYRVMFRQRPGDDCLTRGDSLNLRLADWPIIWCPDAAYHEQDNIPRAQGDESYQP